MKIKNTVCILIFGLAFTGCSEKSSTSAVAPNVSPDFFPITVDTLLPADQEWQRPSDCRANIEKVLCEVDTRGNGDTLSRPCIGGEIQYKAAVEAIYDGMDEQNQKMFCSLRRIFIERNFYATAYASNVYQRQANGKSKILPGAVVGIRKSVLQTAPNFLFWISWKEQLNFTEINNEFEIPLPYPRYTSEKNLMLLQYVFAHEFGHLFDFANQINDEILGIPDCNKHDIKNDEDYYRYCKPFMKPGSWGDISWKDSRDVKEDHDFFGRDKLCFYNCKNRMNVESEMPRFYEGLANSDFISSYAASNHMDDFAEAWAIRWLFSTGANLKLKATENMTVDYAKIYNSEKFKAKREFMERFAKGDVRYP